MTGQDNDSKPTLNLGNGGGTLELRRTLELGRRPAAAGNKAKTVMVEVKRKRVVTGAPITADGMKANLATNQQAAGGNAGRSGVPPRPSAGGDDTLSARERATRMAALQKAGPAEATPVGEEPLKRIIPKAPPVQPVAAEPVVAPVATPVAEAPAPVAAAPAEPPAAEKPVSPAAPAATAKPAETKAPAPAQRPAAPAEAPPVVPLRTVTQSFQRPVMGRQTRTIEARPATPAPRSERRPEGAQDRPRNPGGGAPRQGQRPEGGGQQREGQRSGHHGGGASARPTHATALNATPGGTGNEPLKRLVRRFDEPLSRRPLVAPAATPATTPAAAAKPAVVRKPGDEDDARGKKKLGLTDDKKSPLAAKKGDAARRSRKITVTAAMSDGVGDDRQHSLAAAKRRREREKLKMKAGDDRQKITREITVPEAITVQELANRMAERTAAVVKELMKIGVMATATQTIDADTAELVATEMGHTVRRVADSDVEIGIEGDNDTDTDLLARPPVVTIMGHVDHGKTSLLDALRATDVAAREAGGITQHIGAYKVTLPNGQAIAFIDTPGHEAFTEMRARGANVTDIVVLVVAADDGIMPQTVEAINHAKAAGVPIIVAINKMDKPDADPMRVKTALLQHSLVVEDMGGDIQAIEVSAKAKINLDKLEEAILLQAEILELRANPNRMADGTIIESQLDVGRGSVATVLVQRGTLNVGDIFVAGAEWGKVRALVDDHGRRVKEALPGTPVEVLGLNGTPQAGDKFTVVESEAKARQISDYRKRQIAEKAAVAAGRGSVEQMLSQIAADSGKKEITFVVKTDVHGSLEAILASLQKIGNDEVSVRVLHSGVGSITESDITLAKATNGQVIGFNVRANPQARDSARRDHVQIRYYSIIYQLIDDTRAMLGGLLAPEQKEIFLGYAEIRDVFNITKVGNVAGCYVTEGVIKRGCGVRLLRDNVVIHEGKLKTLKRFKEEVKEVKSSFECGMAFENYSDIRTGDQIECFEVQEVARTLE